MRRSTAWLACLHRSSACERVSARLLNDGSLGVQHAPALIRQKLDGPLRTVWGRGSVSVGELWAWYTRHAYLPRLRDRSVLDTGVRDGLSLMTWEREGFALATGLDEATGRYTGLVLPSTGVTPFGPVMDSTLLVAPDIAKRQHLADLNVVLPPDMDPMDVPIPTNGVVTLPPPEPEDPPAGPRPRSRFFGVYRIRSAFYAKDLNRLQAEVLTHLANAGDLELTVEITAHKADGYTDDEIRTVSENARVLKFDQATFDEE